MSPLFYPGCRRLREALHRSGFPVSKAGMFPQIRVTASMALAILLAGCANVSVTTDYDRAADFSKYRTYAWEPEPRADQSIEKTIHRAVDAGLAAKACTLSSRPAFLVRARFAAKEQIAVHRHTDWGGAGTWQHTRQAGDEIWPVASYTLTDVDRFTEGTVLLDFLDAKSRHLIWHGEGAIVFGTAAENVRGVGEAISQLLKRFPPKPRRPN
jgi:hypothetical protein